MSDQPSVVIVSPALADANNGNWRTAQRWCRFVEETGTRVRIVRQWPDASSAADRVMIALHARRSAPSIAGWSAQRGAHGLALVLTGTDLYEDLLHDEVALRSLELATALVVLQPLGISALPARWRGKARAIYQSTQNLPAIAKPEDHLHALMVGHLREVKSPGTLMTAAVMLRDRAEIRISHIGEAPEAAWRNLAEKTAAECPNYHWHGARPHEETRAAIQQAHVLVHTSRLEGGAHVIMEAVCSGTPVLASRVDGNVGMLGEDYAGYFDHGDASRLARLLVACREAQHIDDPARSLLARLRAQCALRAPLFDPARERAAVVQLVKDLQETP